MVIFIEVSPSIPNHV